MPTVKDKITGKVISRQPYNQEGIQNAATIAESNPKWEVSNALDRSEPTYAGGGYVSPLKSNLLEDIAKKGLRKRKYGEKATWVQSPGDTGYKKGGKVKK